MRLPERTFKASGIRSNWLRLARNIVSRVSSETFDLSLNESRIRGKVTEAHNPPLYGQKDDRSSRGSELFLVENKVLTGGRMMYSPRETGPPSRYNANYFLQASAGTVVIQGRNDVMVRVDPQVASDGKPKITWQFNRFSTTSAIASVTPMPSESP